MPNTPIDVQAFLSLARDRYEFGREADKADRQQAEDDNSFAHADDVSLGQWDKKAKKQRKNRPILQWNRLPTFLQQVANDGRQNRPAIKISRGDEISTAHTANFYTARIRHIEYESNVDTAKDCARDQQITTGRGWLRVSTEWIPGTQNQRILVDRIENQFSVVDDPAARKYDRSDSDWRFIVSQISKAQHIRKYGKESIVSQMDFAHADSSLENWVGVGDKGEMVQIAEYWHKEYTTQIVPASDGQPARTEQVATVIQSVINGAEILSETTWLGSTIPSVPFWGKEAIVGGERRTFSLTRNAKEPQRLLNLELSNLAEQTGQQTKSPWLVPAGGIAANHEDDWAHVHITPLGYLIYQKYDANGRELPEPKRATWEPPIQALLETINTCIDGIKAALGIFDASMGAKSNETSGIAIQRRQKESDVTNYHFPSNELRSNKYLGEILVELIKILDRPGSSVPVRTIDGKTHIVPIGSEHADWKTGELVTHDLMSGQYGVMVSSDRSFDTQRQEAYDRDAAMITAQPELMFVIGDQLFANDDTAGAEERSDRLKRYIQMKTPGLIQDKNQQGPDPQALQQQIQQIGQKLQVTEAFAQKLHADIQQKSAELAMEKYKVDEQEKTKRVLGLATVDQRDAIALLQQELGSVNARFDRAHEQQLQAQQHQHEADQAAAAQQHAAGMQDAGHQAAAESQDSAQGAAQEAAERESAQQEATEPPESAE